MPDDSIPGPTPTGYQRTQGGGVKWQPPSAEHLSKLLPQYDIECILGYGGMGAVYKGKQKSLDRAVAIKILPPEVDDEDASYVERFKNEARVMAKFTHPAIVAVYDFGETSEGQLYIVMEFVDGTDVQKMLQAQGRLPPEHALAITAHVCDALRYAHEHGVIHRDIKPANILINMEGAVKVADFGLAKAEEAGASGLTKTGMAMGTPDYVAPETLVMGVNVDGRADLYAMGVMLYAMLTGNVPRGAFKPVSVMLPGTDPRFDHIVQKAMQMDREERYQSAAAIRRDLDVILTTPLMQAGGQSSAAIPKQSLPQKPVAKGPQKPMGKSANVPVRGGAAVGQARRLPDLEEAAGAAALQSQPAKSKSLAWVVPTFISAIVIIGGAFMMRGKVVVTPAGEEETSKHHALASAAASSSTPIKVLENPKTSRPSTPVTRLSPSTEPWQDVLRDPARLSTSGGAERTSEGLRFTNQGTARISKPEPRDGAVRIVAVYGEPRVQLRARETPGTGLYLLTLNHVTKDVHLARSEGGSSGITNMRIFPLPEPIQPGQDFELELRAVGQILTVKFNGVVLGTVTDNTYSKGSLSVGTFERTDTPALVKALEILDLDSSKPVAVAPKVPSPSVSPSPSLIVLKSPPPAFPPGQWVKVFTKFEDLPEELRKPYSGVKFENGWIRSGSTPRRPLHLPSELQGNYGARGTFKRHGTAPLDRGQIALRLASADKASYASYQSFVSMDSLRIQSQSDGKTLSLAKSPVTQIPVGATYAMEFAVVGRRLVSRLDGRTVATSLDSSFPTGPSQIEGQDDLRDIEVINLDGIPEAEALKILGVDEKGNDLRVAALAAEKQSMKQKQQGQTISTIPELATLDEQFKKLSAERVTAPFEAELAKLNTGYIGGIDRDIAREKAAGHLDGVLVLEAEKKFIVASSGTRSQGADGLRLPMEFVRIVALPILLYSVDSVQVFADQGFK